MVKRFLIPLTAFVLGSAFIASFYIGILTWAQGWDYASSQLVRDRWYVIPIIIGFGVQAALYTILRFRLFIPISSTGHAGSMMGEVEAHPPLQWLPVVSIMSPTFFPSSALAQRQAFSPVTSVRSCLSVSP
jgi:hypothetical protein